jgi:hypothetical protein
MREAEEKSSAFLIFTQTCKMKRALIFSLLVFASSLCFGQGFDKEMVEAGKRFHKNSQKMGRSAPTNKKQKRVSTSGAGRSTVKNKKGVSTLDGTKKKKKNKARRKGHRQKS